jgi:hypothetical protein
MVNEGRNMLNEMCCKMEWYRSLNPAVAKNTTETTTPS